MYHTVKNGVVLQRFAKPRTNRGYLPTSGYRYLVYIIIIIILFFPYKGNRALAICCVQLTYNSFF